MKHEVIVVGAGIGGLAVSALLSARGVNVCLLERNSTVGGCLASHEHLGHAFENSYGLFAGCGAGEIQDRIFTELKIERPQPNVADPSFVIRLWDHSDIAVGADEESFERQIQSAFPESAEAALQFYRESSALNRTLKQALTKLPELQTADQKRQVSAFFPNVSAAFQILKASTTRAHEYLDGASPRFRAFLDGQLQFFAQCTSNECSRLFAAAILDNARRMCAFSGGSSVLYEALLNSIKRDGGKVRLDSPVLRLAFESGVPVGVDLLSGERIEATRAVISNLTIWDTYGKLVGLSQTPNEIRKQLGSFTSYGAYLIYATITRAAIDRLPSSHLLAMLDPPSDGFDPLSNLFLSVSDRRDLEPVPVTIHSVTEADDWFSFHNDQSELESQDQQMLERRWSELHSAFPELGDGIEIVDTATPQSSYDSTRRKLGLVGGVKQLSHPNPSRLLSHKTPFPTLLRVGDTCLPGGGVAGVLQSALIVANELTR